MSMENAIDDIHIIYLLVAIVTWILGYFHTGRFVRPKWKIPGKFLFYIAVSFGLAIWINHLSLIFIIGHPLVGIIFHIRACQKNGINWVKCEPREEYLKLQEKWARGEFTRKNDEK